MLTPGADTTTEEFRSENDARFPLALTAATEITPVKDAGYEYGVKPGPLVPSFPAAATTTTLWAIA